MNRRRLIVLLALVVLVGGGVVSWFLVDPHEREVKRVQRRLRALAEAVSFAENDPPFKRFGYPQRVIAFFDANIELDVHIGVWQKHSLVGRGELLEGATKVRTGFRGLSVQFLDPAVRLDEDLRSAVVHLTSKIYVTGESDYAVQEFRLALVKTGSEWMVRKVETVKTMQ